MWSAFLIIASTVLADSPAFAPAIPDPVAPGLQAKATPSALTSALAAKGADYQPRTHHLRPNGAPEFTNRLILETSPYLLQHAHNPVSWYPWSDEPFDRARAEGKLVLLSVGYSTCHWCHVMERESFEDLEIARYLNQHFVAIKVDREERPDVDGVYMQSVYLLAGRGGWPMTVVMTPDSKPVFGGTYFPARDGDRGTRRGFLTLLKQLVDLQHNDPQKLASTARSISEALADGNRSDQPGKVPGAVAITRAVSALNRSFDDEWGGFGRAPKFPRPVNLELLARHYRRTQSPRSRQMIELTLERMAAGGMHDHVGGGFHRYATDRQWLVPHFEKMLYDNAQLTMAYLEGFQITRRQSFAEVARSTLDYILREMTADSGGFYSATDADSPKGHGEYEEGLFHTWTPAELAAVLGKKEAERFAGVYGVTERGNFEGRSILHLPEPIAAAAVRFEIKEAQLAAELARSRQALYAERARRAPPILDDKIIAAWNGLMISAFAKASLVLGEPAYATAAIRAAEFQLAHGVVDGHLYRTHNDGRARHRGYLDDYAFVIAGLLDLHEATSEPRWLREAKSLQAVLDAEFTDEAGGYFFTSDQHASLLIREKPDYDGAEPSGNSVAMLNLLRLEQLTGDDTYRQRAVKGLGAFSQAMTSRGQALPKMLSALDFLLDQPLQVVIISPPGGDPEPLLAEVRRTYLPNRILSVGEEGDQLAAQLALVPMLEDKVAMAGEPTAYVCRGRVCDRPTRDPAVLREQLRVVKPL